MYTLNISDIAENDILSTINYIAKVLCAPMAANKLLDAIENSEEILEDTPDVYPFVPDEYLSRLGLRYVLIKNFMLFFTVREDKKTVTVVRFLYGRRDWKNILIKEH